MLLAGHVEVFVAVVENVDSPLDVTIRQNGVGSAPNVLPTVRARIGVAESRLEEEVRRRKLLDRAKHVSNTGESSADSPRGLVAVPNHEHAGGILDPCRFERTLLWKTPRDASIGHAPTYRNGGIIEREKLQFSG